MGSLIPIELMYMHVLRLFILEELLTVKITEIRRGLKKNVTKDKVGIQTKLISINYSA